MFKIHNNIDAQTNSVRFVLFCFKRWKLLSWNRCKICVWNSLLWWTFASQCGLNSVNVTRKYHQCVTRKYHHYSNKYERLVPIWNVNFDLVALVDNIIEHIVFTLWISHRLELLWEHFNIQRVLQSHRWGPMQSDRLWNETITSICYRGAGKCSSNFNVHCTHSHILIK